MTDLITLAEYKAYAGIASTTSTADAKIQSFITSSSAIIKAYCGRTFVDYADTASTKVEYFTGYGNTLELYVKEFPIINVITVEASTDSGVTYSEVDYVIDREYDCVYVASGAIYTGPNAFRVTYTGGFTATPEALKVACYDLVDYYYKNESTMKKTNGYLAIEYVTSASFPPHIRRVLDLFRSLS